MGKRLTDNVNSNYFSAANSLRPKNARRRIVAYVESYDDILFWRTLLSLYEDGTRYFEVMLPSHRTLERGKRSALMSLLYGKTGADMLACVDADYDYLMQGASETSREIISNPAILHTYAYSIENLQCYAPSLHNVCVMVTLNDRKVFDLQNFMTRFSEIIFPLFVWSIWHYRRGVYGQFTITDFNRTIELGGFNINRPQDALDNLRSKVMRKVNYMNRQHPEAEQEYKELSAELVRLGVEPEQTYLYIQGHHLFDKIVMPVMNKVCGMLIREREAEIRRQAVHTTQMYNELSCYAHSVQDITQMLKKNNGFTMSPQFAQMRREVEKFLEIKNKS
jgi:hypothetical protein